MKPQLLFKCFPNCSMVSFLCVHFVNFNFFFYGIWILQFALYFLIHPCWQSFIINITHLSFYVNIVCHKVFVKLVSIMSVPKALTVFPALLLWPQYNDVIMSPMASQITSLTIVYSAVYSGTYQRKHQRSASLTFVMGIHRWPVNSSHKGPVMRKMFLLDDVTMPHKCIFSFLGWNTDVTFLSI